MEICLSTLKITGASKKCRTIVRSENDKGIITDAQLLQVLNDLPDTGIHM